MIRDFNTKHKKYAQPLLKQLSQTIKSKYLSCITTLTLKNAS